jgi:hypothetical protein
VKIAIPLGLALLLFSACTPSGILQQATPSTDSTAAFAPRASKSVDTQSVVGVYVVSGASHKEIFGHDCTLHRAGKAATGCTIAATKSATYANSTFTIYTGPNDLGCPVAAGTYSGKVNAGKTIPVHYKVMNLTCWK